MEKNDSPATEWISIPKNLNQPESALYKSLLYHGYQCNDSTFETSSSPAFATDPQAPRPSICDGVVGGQVQGTCHTEQRRKKHGRHSSAGTPHPARPVKLKGRENWFQGEPAKSSIILANNTKKKVRFHSKVSKHLPIMPFMKKPKGLWVICHLESRSMTPNARGTYKSSSWRWVLGGFCGLVFPVS